MIDINIIREKPEVVRGDLEKRGEKEMLGWVEEIKKGDEGWRKLKQEVDELRRKRNEISLKINELKKKKKSVGKLLKEAKGIPGKIEKKEKEMEKLKKEIDGKLVHLPNILHSSVPAGKDDTENVEVRKWGKIPEFKFELRSHVEIMEKLGAGDFERSAKIAGTGFYFLKGDLVLLEQALIRFGLEVLKSKGFTLVWPPLMMRRKAYEGVIDFSDFETMIYKVEGHDGYLIATSEHPLVAQHTGEILEERDLPLKYAGISPCFRSEIGAHGIDEKGIFRVHQFNKVEQIIFCKPEESWGYHEELIRNAEDVFQALELPYRVVNVCTGDIGKVAAKKYDWEAWLPRQGKYREMGSCSNCTDYQARRLGIRYRKGNKTELVHTLNSTAIAVGRAMVAIMENFQEKDGGVRIPKVLWPYMEGIRKIERK